jgi:hypothetical protein
MPELLEENEDAWDLWSMSGTQWRTGGMGLVGLDYNAVWKVAETIEIEMSVTILRKLRALEHAMIERQRDDMPDPGSEGIKGKHGE